VEYQATTSHGNTLYTGESFGEARRRAGEYARANRQCLVAITAADYPGDQGKIRLVVSLGESGVPRETFPPEAWTLWHTHDVSVAPTNKHCA
jgi:hypothetical protein